VNLPSAYTGPTDTAGPLAGSPKVVVYSDGACRGNPGPSAAGWVIEATAAASTAPAQRFVGNLYLGHHTNNEAEYLAATLGLQAAADFGAQHVELRVDSELLCRQLQGRYQVKNARIRPLFTLLQQISRRFLSFRVQHVRREFNRAADAQANEALDALAKPSRPA
jgi:ribonuclease HI